jgi:hypothetical protein
VSYRFVIEKLLTAQVASHADIAARLLEHLVARKRHYDEVVLPALREMNELPPPDRALEGAWNATAAQLLAAANDLLRLMEDARAQGVPNLQRRGRSAGPKLDLTLGPPTSADPREVAATIYVMQDGLRGAARDVSDEIGRLNAWLGVCADPAAREFVEQLAKLAAEIRPDNAPPGPYAPGQVELAGPRDHVALMRSYEVEIVAAFEPDVDLIELVLRRLPAGSPGPPRFGALSDGVDVVAATTADAEFSTLRVTYSSRGKNPEEATQYAIDAFKRTCSELALPEPVRLAADSRERDPPD